MGRKRTHKPDFSARIEQLEDRRVMSADPLVELTSGIQHHDLDETAPPVEQTVVAPVEAPPVDLNLLGDPDFWIDTSDAGILDDYFQEVEQALTEAHNQTGWFNVRSNYGFTGLGQTVAVIDSGIAYNHFALGGGLGSNYRVVGGWDFTEENDNNPYDDGTSGGHGTHVSGIIGSSATSNTGVAPGVDFVGLRVFNDAGAGYFSWVEKALRWVYENRDAYENPITTVNLSLGVSNWNAATIPLWANLEDEFAQLESVGIFIAVSAGNAFGTFATPGLSYPAASQYVVPVMSSDDNGSLSYYSQRLARAIAAPGRTITSTIPDYKGNKNGVADDFGAMSGTSMAAPYVAGASVIIREAMEFVGMTNITQDMIYNHMMATADTIYDAATKLSYKRLDLGSAIDALMPADDYGSTAATAHNLGALAGTSTVSGAIGKLNDADFFRFTAAQSGNVTFELTEASQNLTGRWQAYDASGKLLGTQNGTTISLAVAAGQAYTVEFSATGGMGHYSFEATAAASSISIKDWGSVVLSHFDDTAVAGEAWYRVVATQDGIFTVQGAFSAAGGNVNVELYNASRQLIAGGKTTGGLARVDATAAAGTEFLVRVTGANSDVDFTLANLVRQLGTSVTINGTDGDDVFTFTAGAVNKVSVNGVEYSFAANAAKQFTFNGRAGADSITMTGSAAADTATLAFASAQLASNSYNALALGIETVNVHGGGGADRVIFHDTAGNDRLVSRQTHTTMTGAGFSHYASGFATVEAYATAGDDECELYDSAGNDQFRSTPTISTLKGNGYSRLMSGFDRVYAHSTAGGYDTAEMWDSRSDDVFTARPTYATLRTSVSFTSVHNFQAVYAFANAGGRDFAFMYDSAGDDVFLSQPKYSLLRGTKFYNYASGFDSVRAFSTAGGKDVSWLVGSTGADTALIRGDQTWLYGAGSDRSAQGFSTTTVMGMGGRDVVRMQDLDGKDAVYGAGNKGSLTRAGRVTSFEGFEHVIAMHLASMAPSINVRAVDYLFERLKG